ncbi:MAG: DUF192 domain-containing protein [Patescibacteria group bacterium]
MQVFNETQGVPVAAGVRDARAFSAKAVGLIGAASPRALFFRTRWGIHTVGMRFPIDVVIFDEEGTVRAARECLKPFRAFFWNPRWRNVLELPAGTIARTGTRLGDRLSVEPET